MRNEEDRSFKVRAVKDIQPPPQQCIEEYISNSSVGSDDNGPTMRWVPRKATTLVSRRTRQTVGKMSASRATKTIASTQTVEAKNKKRKRVVPYVSSDTVTVSSGVETINVDDDEEDAKSPDMSTVLLAKMPRKATAVEELALEAHRKVATVEERSRLGADVLGDSGLQKTARSAPPNPIKIWT